jgi:8-oxo-dGTP pyrophosphatase MutT (NUDIX family)
MGEEQPANAASVAIVRDRRVLLVRRAKPPYDGLWSLPGGRCEPGETSIQAATREVVEELGLLVPTIEWLTRIAATPEWLLDVFLADEFSGEVSPSSEIADWRWAGMENAAELATTPGLLPILALALRRCAPLA